MERGEINPLWRLWRAEGYRMMDMLEEAIGEMKALGEEGSRWLETHMVTAAIKYDERDWAGLLPLARRLRELFPETARWISYEAESLNHLVGVWEATRCVLRALPRFPKETEFRYLLHYLHRDSGNHENARYWISEALRLDPEAGNVVESAGSHRRGVAAPIFAAPRKVPRGKKHS